MIRRKSKMRSFEDFQRKQLKNIKIRAAYNRLAEEFARAEKKIKARKKKKPTPLRAAPPRPAIRRNTKPPHRKSEVARMESDHSLPSTTSLEKYAKAAGHKVQIKLKAG